MFVAATSLTSTWIVFVLPTAQSCARRNTLSIFTCVAGSISPISSGKIVPPSAASKRLSCATAPVNPPRGRRARSPAAA